MTERNIFNIIKKIEGVSNFDLRNSRSSDDINYFDFAFEFSDYRYVGTQAISPLFTVNKISLTFRYTLKKETTKLKILEAINQYNIDRPILKVSLNELTTKTMEISFAADFINDDQKIDESQIIPIINIMASCPADFVGHLNRKKIILNHS